MPCEEDPRASAEKHQPLRAAGLEGVVLPSSPACGTTQGAGSGFIKECPVLKSEWYQFWMVPGPLWMRMVDECCHLDLKASHYVALAILELTI